MIKMSLHDNPHLNLISAYADGKVTIHNKTYAVSLIVLPSQVITNWSVATIDDLDSNAVQMIVQHQPEVVLLGSGNRQHFPHPQALSPLMQARIGYEVMDNAAACRTYNILLSEGREAALALIV